MRMHKNAVKPSVHDKQLTARTACHFWIWVCVATPSGKFSELHRPLAVKFGPHDFAASECLRCTGAGTFGKHYFFRKPFPRATWWLKNIFHRVFLPQDSYGSNLASSFFEVVAGQRVTWEFLDFKGNLDPACSMQHYAACTMIWAGLYLICSSS